MKNNKLFVIFSLFAIFSASLFLRLYRLDQNTPSLYVDEVAGSYKSLVFLNTPISNLLDLITKAKIGPTSFSWILGLTPIGTRLPSALYGSLISIVAFFFALSTAKRMIPNKSRIIAFLTSFFAVVLPWSFMISRIGHSSVPIIVLLVCLHLIVLINAKNTLGYLISLIPLGISVIFYPSLVVIAPVAIVLVFYLLTNGQSRAQKRVSCLIFFTVVVVLSFVGITRYQILNPKARALDLAIWRDVNVTADSNNYRGLSRRSTPTIFSFGKDTELLGNKLVYNFPISVSNVFIRNYLSFFTPDFLFLKGDNILRHSTGMVGEFFPILIPFMLYGAFVFFTKADKKLKAIFLVWILVSPVPAAITKDGATYLLRAITMMPFLTYFCAQGIVSSFVFFKNIYLKIVYGFTISVIGLYSIYSFLFGYFHVYPALSAAHWEYGFKEVSDFQTTHPGKILVIWDDKYPVWYFCFWQKLPPYVCDQENINNSEMINDSRIDLPIDNLFFSLPKTGTDLDLIITKYKPANVAIPVKYETFFPSFKKNATLVQIIKYPDQTTAFTVYSIKNKP